MVKMPILKADVKEDGAVSIKVNYGDRRLTLWMPSEAIANKNLAKHGSEEKGKTYISVRETDIPSDETQKTIFVNAIY